MFGRGQILLKNDLLPVRYTYMLCELKSSLFLIRIAFKTPRLAMKGCLCNVEALIEALRSARRFYFGFAVFLSDFCRRRLAE